jgi:ubiquinone biosynthesis protein UbiJ
MLSNFLFHPFLNHVLELNNGSLAQLQHNSSKSFKIIAPLWIVSGQIDRDGFICNENDDSSYNVVIHIPATISTYIVNQDKIAAFKQIKFEGDRAFGRELLEILANLNYGVLNVSQNPMALFFQQQLLKVFTGLKDALQLIASNMTNSLTEYLLYESEDLITQYELKQFCDEVDSLDQRTNLLAAKLEYMQK